jgi:hypothetical protein
MVWILNEVNKPVEVRLGSVQMFAAANVYMSEDEAKAAQRQLCQHETILGNRSTGRKFCADCGKPFE